MRTITLLIYFLTIFQFHGVAGTLCSSDGEIAIEGLHFPEVSEVVGESCGDGHGCEVSHDNHSHEMCTDFEIQTLRPTSKMVIEYSAAQPVFVTPIFLKLCHLRAPPNFVTPTHQLPPLYGTTLVSIFKQIC